MKESKKVLQGRIAKARIAADRNNGQILRCLAKSEQLRVRSEGRAHKIIRINDRLESFVEELLGKVSVHDGVAGDETSEHDQDGMTDEAGERESGLDDDQTVV